MSSPTKPTGWKPMPLALKVLFVVLILWGIGSIFAIPMRMDLGLPFFGAWISGYSAGLVVTLLDLVAPVAFLFGLWKRKTWAVPLGITYNAIFIMNSLVALYFYKEQLGLGPLLTPAIASSIFLAVITSKRRYFQD